MKHYNVVAAAIHHDDRYLCVQRAQTKFAYTSFKYEFPGGKIEPGETPEQALKRELDEELGCKISVERLLATVEHTYPDFSITLRLYLCKAPDEKFTFREHINHRWLKACELSVLDWAAADAEALHALE